MANYFFLCPIVPKDTVPIGLRWDSKEFKKGDLTAPPGTGPFKIVDYRKKKGLTYEAFKDYRPGLPYLDKIKYTVIQDDGLRDILDPRLVEK